MGAPRAGRLLLAGGCLGWVLTAGAEPAEWLLRVSEAARQTSYQGVMVYRDDLNRLETLRIAHRFQNGREQERVTSLTGKQRDVFRENDRVVCVIAEEPVHQVQTYPDKLLPALSPAVLRQMAAHYELRDLGDARIAGRNSHGLAIAPRDGYRYGYVIWADAESAVPLKVSLLDADGRVLEQMMFTHVDYASRIPDALFALPPGHERSVPVVPVAAAAGQPVTALPDPAPATAEDWALDRLPPGFAVTMRSSAPQAGGGTVEHILLSDGLSAVSVFSARSPVSESLFLGYSRLGAMNVYGRRVGDFHVTVVGEVPRTTVRMIGDGVRRGAAGTTSN